MTDRSSLLMPALALCVGAALLALVMASPEATDGASTDEVAALRAEVAELRAEVAQMKASRPGRRADRAGRSERRRPASGAAMAAADGGPAAQAALVEVLESDDPGVRESIGSVVRDELEQEREQRWERRQQRWAERQQRQIDELAEQVELSPAQQEGVLELMSTERETISQAFRDARENGSFDEARELAQQTRDDTAAAVRSLLEDEQYEAWTAQREEEQARRGR